MAFITIENTPLVIDFNEALNSRGWELVGDRAIHYPCHPNSRMDIIGYPIEPNKNYRVTFTILAMNSSPQLRLGFDGTLFTYSEPQEVNVIMNTPDTGKHISFWGDGYIEMQAVNIQKEADPSSTDSEDTVTWGEAINRWVSFRSYRPENGFSMFTDFFTYQNGILYQHQETGTRNNFYGQQFNSTIEAPISSAGVKNYHSIAIHSNIVMATTTDGITTSLGQVSDLIETDFTTRDGIHYANFLRDKLTDLVSGDRLVGRYIVLTLTPVDGSQKLQLFKIVEKGQLATPSE